MNNWVIFITCWILLQTMYKACRKPMEPAGITGSILWGVFMFGSLYMAGLYN